MAQITGTDGAERLKGTTENDRIEGLAGDDWIEAGAGNDTVLGGDGHDVLESQGGADSLSGESGNDRIVVMQGLSAGERVLVSGGAGHDEVVFDLWGAGGGLLDVDAGDGDDTIRVIGTRMSTALLRLGAGRDTVYIGDWHFPPAHSPVLVADFQPGAAGDRIDWDEYFKLHLERWDQESNPFASGHLRIVQQGADALLQMDSDGPAGQRGFETLITFQNVAAGAFTAENFGGYNPAGGPVVGQEITGTDGVDGIRGSVGADIIEGLGGNDQLVGRLGHDALRGGDGDDQLAGEDGNDVLEGGLGTDSLAGGIGNDRLLGGEGDDNLVDSGVGSDQLWGEDGNDTISVVIAGGRSNATTDVTVYGGAGNDAISLDLSNDGPGHARVDAGPGSDTIILVSAKPAITASVTLGEGGDVVLLHRFFQPGSVVIEDFEPGNAGDRLDWLSFLSRRLFGWDGGTNPFSTGHLRLTQSGADTILEIDFDGPARLDFGHKTLLTFRNADRGSFNGPSLSGFAPDGSVPASLELTGTAGDDRLEGATGADRIDGGSGNDAIAGGAGHDTLRGGDGDDDLNGGIGSDLVEGGAGGDVLDGGDGADRVYGGEGDDRLSSSYGSSTELHGEAGNDILIVSHDQWQSDDRGILASGGAGDDTVFVRVVSPGAVTVNGGAGADVVVLQGVRAPLRIALGEGADTVRIDPFYNFWDGSATIIEDFMPGPNGDRLDWDLALGRVLPRWDGAADPFAAGYLRLIQDGADTLIQLDAGGPQQWGDFATVMRLKNASASLFGAINFDGYNPHARSALTGTDAADLLSGSAGRDAIDGGLGDDVLNAGTADDWLDGGPGADRMRGGAGDDVYIVDDMRDLVEELSHEGLDEVRTGVGSRSDVAQMYTLPANVENLTGTSASGQGVYGNALNNVIRMGAGDDLVVVDGGGVDRVEGGDGNDFIYFGSQFIEGDSVDGGGGYDTVALKGSFLALAFAPDDLLGVERLALYSSGRPGWPTYFDLTMADANVAAGEQLMVVAQSLGANEALRFNGAAETDGRFNIRGTRGGDTITGGAGNDTIWGNLGADTLRGGAGNDIFEYRSTADSTASLRDNILDFAGGDRIKLTNIDADGAAVAGNGKFAFIGGAAFSGTAGELRVSQDPNFARAWLVEGDTNGDMVADFSLIVVAPNAYPLGKDDFFL